MRSNHRLVKQTLEMATAIQQIPAPTFQEAQRAAFIRSKFLDEGLADVSIDCAGNICARIPGQDPSIRPLIVSAHMDTVFPPDADLTLRRNARSIHGAGIGDNALGTAGLFGLLWLLRERSIILPGDLWLIASVGEEGLGDLKGMRAVVERFGDHPIAYLVLEGIGLGEIYYRGLSVKRYSIRVQTRGGHSWIDHGSPSAIHTLARLVTELTALPLPVSPRSTLNIGKINGGMSVNTIAAEAHLELDLRSEDCRTLEDLSAKVEALAQATNQKGVQCTAQVIGRRPPGQISRDHPLVQLATEALISQGLHPKVGIGSTDANIPLSKGLPAICIGLSNGAGAHTGGEYILTQPIAAGLEQLFYIVTRTWQALGSITPDAG